MTDFENDPRPLAECLKEFATAVNGGQAYGARARAAEELRINPATLRNMMAGRKTDFEPSLRRLMTLISADAGTEKGGT